MNGNRLFRAVVLAGLFLCTSGLRAVVVYWDSNGPTAGAGATPTGTWGTNSFWGIATGASTPASWTSGDVAVFSAGSDATGSYTVTVSGTQTIGGLTVEEGTPTLSGGSLSFAAATNFDITGNATINSVLAGTGSLNKAGTGTLFLSGANTYANGTSVSQGTLAVTGGSISHSGTDVRVGDLASNSAIMTISGGATVSGNFGFAGAVGSSTGTVTISDSSSAWNSATNLVIGSLGTGVLTVSSGGTALAAGNVSIGAGNTGTATVTGSGSLISAGASVLLGNTADGSLTVTNDGMVRANNGSGSIALGSTSGSGTLNLGAGSAAAAAAGGIVNAAGITTGSGTGIVQFNTTGSFYLTKDGTSGGTAVVISGGTEVINTAGHNVVSGSNTYTGKTTINGGILEVTSLANGGAASSIGASSNAAANLMLDGGTLRYTGGSGSTDRLFTLGVNGGTIDGSSPTFVGNFTFTNTGSIALAGTNTARTLTLDGTPGNSSSIYFNPQIGDNGSGATSLHVLDGAFFRLSGANTYSGGTTIENGGLFVAVNSTGSATGTGTVTINSGGRLSVGSNSPDGAISSNVVNHGSLEFNRSSNYTYSGVISGTGSVQHTGTAGVITLTGANTYTGTTIIGGSLGGALAVDSLANGGQTSGIGASSNAAANLHLSNGGTLRYMGGTASTDRLFIISGGAGTIDSAGTGLLTFSNTGAFGFNNPNVATTLTLTGAFLVGYNYFNPLIVDNGTAATSVVIDGASNWALTSANTYTGGTTLNGNSLLADNASGSATGSGPITINAGYLQIGNGGTTGSVSGAITNHGTINFIRSDAITFGNGISGTGSLYKAGTNTLTLAGTNTYSGVTLVDAGTLVDGATNAFSPNSAIQVAAGANLATNFNETIGGLADDAGAGGNVAISGGTTLQLNMAGANSFSGAVGGAGALAKTGLGTQTLAGFNTYTGGTAINGGTLALNGGSISHSGADLTVGTNSALAVTNAGSAFVNHGFIGYGAAGGTATVNGSGSLLSVSDELIVGAFGGGQGTMTISSGGTVNAFRTSISYIGPGTSHLTVTGAGSSLNSTTYLYVGSAGGNARLNVLSGATATSATGVIGLDGGYGWATLTGSGSIWDVTSGVYVGYNSGSTGYLQLNDNSRLNAVSGTGTVTLGSNGAAGTLIIGESEYFAAGGIVNAASITTGSGTGLVRFDTGTTSASPYYLTKDGTAGGTAVTIDGPTQVEHDIGYTVLNGANTYTGTTTISGGTLVAANNSALGTSSVVINGGTLALGSGVNFGNSIAFGVNGGKLAGEGTFTSPLTLGAGVKLAPGSSPGTMNFASSLTLNNGGSLEIEVRAPSGTPGTDWDFVSIAGTFNLGSLTAGNYSLKVISLDLANNPGAVSGLTGPTSWVIATAGGGISGFEATDFAIDISQFVGGGTFVLSQATNDLVLSFTPVPEPSTYALMLSGLALAGLQWHRRRNRA